MRETFAEYKARMLRIVNDQATEWQAVCNAVAAFDQNQEQFDRTRFRIINARGAGTALTLDDVCAVLSRTRPTPRMGPLFAYTIRFARRPATPGDFFDDSTPAPIENEEWSATPAVEQNEFRWVLRKGNGEGGEEDGEHEPMVLSAADLADEIAKGLAEYYLKYEAANPS